MNAVTSSTFRKNLRDYLNRVRDDAEPLLVTSKDPTANAVVINAAEYENLMENLHVWSNEYLVEKLRRGREDVEAHKECAHDLTVVE